jgi:HK97 family phage portal protein
MNQSVNYRILGIPLFSKTVSNVSEKRSASSDLSNPPQWFMNAIGGVSSSGVVVNENTALTLSAVWSAIRILGETLAVLPLNIFERTSEGQRKIDYSNPLQYLLHDKPNQLMHSFTFRETMQLHTNLTGNAYSIIHRDSYNRPGELELIENPRHVMVTKYKGEKYYLHLNKTYTNNEILHIPGMGWNGLIGKNPIECARENIGTGISLQNFGGTFFKNGARMSGVLETTGALDDKAFDRLKDSWRDSYSGQENVGKTAILENGTKYTPISLSNEDAQYLLSRQFSIDEIARIFRVPPHMLASLASSTNNNIEHQGIEFATYTMLPHIVKWEQELNDKLIPVADRGRKYIKFNMNALLRGDAASRAAMYKERFYTSSITPNEIRKLEDENEIEDEHSNEVFVAVNMVPSSMIGMNIKKEQY